MSYLLQTAQQADLDLKSLNNVVLQRRIISRLLELAQSPSRVATRPARPPLPVGQVFEFTFSLGGDRFWVAAVFQFTQDEVALEVTRIFVEMID